MSQDPAAALFDLASGRSGHFRLESGYHAGLWLDLDALFADASRIAPFVDTLTQRLRPYRADVVCGALVGGAFLAQLVASRLYLAFCFTEKMMQAGHPISTARATGSPRRSRRSSAGGAWPFSMTS